MMAHSTTRFPDVRFRVVGAPVQQGSKTLMPNHRVVEAADSRLRPWRALVTDAAMAKRNGHTLDGPLWCRLVFWLPRPKAARSPWCDKRPDVDKLTRAVLDVLTDTGTIHDDARVADLRVEKRYATEHEPVGVLVRVGML